VSAKRRCRLRFVSELIDQFGQWRVDLINQYFVQADIFEILKLNPSSRLDADLLAWAPQKHGLFTVQSAYGLAMEETWRPTTVSPSSGPNGMRNIWDLIWKSDAPPKVQHFAWRLATDSLPTWRNKHKRNLEITDQCPVCGVEPEDNFYPFFHCTLSKQLWYSMDDKWQLPDLCSVLNTGVDWLLNFICTMFKGMICKVLMILWRLWHIRNEIVQ
jgi:hypothetical protein